MSAQVNVEQISNVFVRVDCEQSIAAELSDFFTFDAPNSRFDPRVKSRHWDGKIRLFSLKTYQIYAGLTDYIIEFCKLKNYTYNVNLLTDSNDEPINSEHLNAWNIPSKYVIRDYQLRAWQLAMKNKRVTLISPTASGKSMIMYMIARHLLERGKKRGLIIVPTVSLVEQMYSDFADYGWKVEKICQKIYAGQDNYPKMPLVISTWQSIYDLPKSYFSRFDFVIGDEAHTFKATSLKSIMTKLHNCDYRISLTGTLDDSKVNKLVIEGLFGPVRKLTSTKELMEREILAKLNVKCMVLKYSEESSKNLRGKEYSEEMDFLVSHEKRNKFLRNLANSLDGNTLMLYTYVEKHGKPLHELFANTIENRRIFFVCGDTHVLEREEVRRIVEQESNAIILASYGTFSTGINIRRLHNIVFASPTKSKIRVLQSVGRGLRLGDNKTNAILYDIADDLRYKTHTNFTLKHFEARVKMYMEEKFPVKFYNIGIE